MASEPTWRFREMGEDQKHVEPTHREHLAPGGAAEPLVREAIQNSLDVTHDGKPTKVTFTLGRATDAQAYFAALRPHLQAITHTLPEGLPEPQDEIPFLAFEDYNTTGLTGDPSVRNELNGDGSKNHFFRFWHRVGPASEFKRRGSWGVGKVVFSNASRIRTFFGLTLRAGDSGPMLMGEAGLTIHTLQNAVFDWYGYYANHQLRDSHHVLLPVQNGIVSNFAKTFSLSRASTGLSIVVPYVREEVKFNKLACSVIEHYFLPILAGRLEVTIREGARLIEITRNTIDGVVNQLSWPSSGASSKGEIAAVLRLGRWQYELQPKEYVSLAGVGSEGSYVLTKDSFPDKALVQLSDDFAANRRIALRIPVQVRPRHHPQGEEEVRIVLERDESLRTSNVPHLRSGINISKMRSQGAPGVRGLLVVGFDPDQGLLDKLLQASEGPAHMNWEQQGEGYDKAKLLYDDAHKVIGFMRNLVRQVVELLAAPHDDRDMRTLSAFFPDTSDVGKGNGSNVGRRRGRGTETPAAPPPLPAGVIEVVVQSLAPFLHGFRPVENATIELRLVEDADKSTVVGSSDTKGTHRFEHRAAGHYQVTASKAEIGSATTIVNLPAEAGVSATLILRPAVAPRMFTKEKLEDGFAIRGNPEYVGTMRPVRVRLAYAAWGGGKTYNPADFSLDDSHTNITFSGLEESDRAELIVGPNIIRFTPADNAFYIEVRGFDINRGLHVDTRIIDEVSDDRGDE